MSYYRSISLLNSLTGGLALLVCSHALMADHYPGHARLEYGIGISALYSPDYIGSSYSQNQLLPFPFLKYRGERLRIDDGVEARLFDTPDLLLSVSGNGSLPGPDDNPERAGMQKLDPSVELGPSLELRLQHDETTSLWLELPLRFAFTLGSQPQSIGAIFHPKLAWRKPAPAKFDWKLRLAAGPLFADDRFHSYYYDVQAEEVSSSRSAYSSSQGYSGLRTDFTYSRRFDGYWFGGFIRYDSLSRSVIADSPLVSTSSNLTAGIALAWVFSDR